MPHPLPTPTRFELRLQAILREKKIAFMAQKRIWYSTLDYYTPDLIVGTNLIVEVEGSIHEEPWIVTRDRIRRRALEAMGYSVLTVRNEEVSDPNRLAEKIIQRYYETTDETRRVKVTQLQTEGGAEYLENAEFRIKQFSRRISPELARAGLDVDSATALLKEAEPKLTRNQAAMDLIMLNCFGLNLQTKAASDGVRVIDFAATFHFVEVYLGVMTLLFGEKGTVGVKNLLNISAPGFFKNLVFKGGPNINQGIARVASLESLRSQIRDFNENFAKVGIRVEENEVLTEIRATRGRFRTALPEGLEWVAEI